MPPVVVGIAVAAGAAAVGFVTTVAAAVALGVAVAAATKYLGDALVPSYDQGNINPAADQQITTQANQPRKIIYGETVVGGQIIGYRKITENSKQYHIFAIHIAAHPCESAAIYEIEGHPLSYYGSAVTASFHLGDQTAAHPLALQHIQGWTNEHVGYETTNAYLKVEIDPNLFPSGVNDIKFFVQGRKIYDPRKDSLRGGNGEHRANDSSTWEYSSNAILCAYDYVRFYGYKPIPNTRIPFSHMAAQANICDEEMLYEDDLGQVMSESRYMVNGVLNTSIRPPDGLKELLKCCAGNIYRPSGKVYLVCAAYSGPYTTTITDADLDGVPDYQPHRPEKELTNFVRAEYVAPDLKWQFTDAPVVKSDQAIVSDGSVLEHNLQYPLVTSPRQVQRLASLHLRRNRAGFVAQLPIRGLRIDLYPGKCVRWIDNEMGIDGEFIIRNFKPDFKSNRTILTIEIEDVSLTADDFTEANLNLPEYSSLPDATEVEPVTGIGFTQTVVANRVGYLTWSHPAPSSITDYKITITSPDGNISYPPERWVKTTQADLANLNEGEYKVSVVAINRFERESPATETNITITEVAGSAASTFLTGSAPPSNAVGEDGQRYFQFPDGIVYLKVSGQWQLDGNIYGQDGDKWLSGTAEPDDNEGTDGDWYILLVTFQVWQKVEGSWEARGVLKGPKGDKGDGPTVTDNGNGSVTITGENGSVTVFDGQHAPIPIYTQNEDGSVTIDPNTGDASLTLPPGYTPELGVDYFNGVDGSFTSYVFKNGTSRPSIPTGGTFDGTTETFPDGTTDLPNFESGKITWRSQTKYTASLNTETGEITWSNNGWSQFRENIIEGATGQNAVLGITSVDDNTVIWKRLSDGTLSPTNNTGTVKVSFELNGVELNTDFISATVTSVGIFVQTADGEPLSGMTLDVINNNTHTPTATVTHNASGAKVLVYFFYLKDGEEGPPGEPGADSPGSNVIREDDPSAVSPGTQTVLSLTAPAGNVRIRARFHGSASAAKLVGGEPIDRPTRMTVEILRDSSVVAGQTLYDPSSSTYELNQQFDLLWDFNSTGDVDFSMRVTFSINGTYDTAYTSTFVNGYLQAEVI
ncbi:fibronectin type III domain-containing protein [Glaciecola sp. 1036]|uniref:fibronectin type III domain-containing protein n=1 Tax=Alteromonadaceae TaxID=72275 RepID=UPI003CFE8634